MFKYSYFNKCILFLLLIFLIGCSSNFDTLNYKISGKGKYWILDNYHIEATKKIIKLSGGFIEYISDQPLFYEGYIDIKIIKTLKNSDKIVKVMQETSFPLSKEIFKNNRLSIGSLQYTMSGDLEQLDFKNKYDLYIYLDFSDKNNNIFNEKFKLKVD